MKFDETMQIAFAVQAAFAHSDRGGSGWVSVSVHHPQLALNMLGSDLDN